MEVVEGVGMFAKAGSQSVPPLFKLGAAGLLLAEALFGMFLPVLITAPSSSRQWALSLLNCFAGGVFLSAGLVHMVPDCQQAQKRLWPDDESNRIPSLYLMLIASGYLLVFFVERVLLDVHGEHAGHVHCEHSNVFSHSHFYLSRTSSQDDLMCHESGCKNPKHRHHHSHQHQDHVQQDQHFDNGLHPHHHHLAHTRAGAAHAHSGVGGLGAVGPCEGTGGLAHAHSHSHLHAGHGHGQREEQGDRQGQGQGYQPHGLSHSTSAGSQGLGVEEVEGAAAPAAGRDGAVLVSVLPEQTQQQQAPAHCTGCGGSSASHLQARAATNPSRRNVRQSVSFRSSKAEDSLAAPLLPRLGSGTGPGQALVPGTASYTCPDDCGGQVEPEFMPLHGAVLLGALAIHTFLECIALGSVADMQAFGSLFIAIASHKAISSLALSSRFFKEGATLKQVACYLVPFSFVAPTAIAIGSYASSMHPLLSLVLTCLATGTFLYIGCGELTMEEFEGDVRCGRTDMTARHALLVKFGAVVFGAVAIALVAMLPEGDE